MSWLSEVKTLYRGFKIKTDWAERNVFKILFYDDLEGA